MKRKIAFIYLFWFILICFISIKMPIYGDDLGHSKSLVTGMPITDIWQIFPSVRIYYNSWGGRALSMVIIQIMLMLPKMVFNICNALVYVMMIRTLIMYVKVSISSEKKELHNDEEYILTSLLFVLMWFFEPDFDDVITWLTGSITYMWMNLVVLLFGLLYYKRFCAPDNKGSKGLLNCMFLGLGYFALGVATGWSVEPSACVMLFTLVLFVIWGIRSKKGVLFHEWCGIVGVIIGVVLLLSAPGNGARSGFVKKTFEAGSFIQVYGHRFLRETFYTALFLLVPIAISVSVYVFKSVAKLNFDKLKRDFIVGKEPLFYCLAFISIYVMTFSSGFANRIFQFPFLMILLTFGLSASSILSGVKNNEYKDRIMHIIMLFCFIMMLMAVVEIVTGMLYANQSGTWFDRTMFYYRVDDATTADLLPGNGIMKAH